jgi:SAM-dependent methyltransferase
MRDYTRFDKYVNNLSQDVYAQPIDDGHMKMGVQAIQTLAAIPEGIRNVLDIGCGQGAFRGVFEGKNLEWTGVTIGEDYAVCEKLGLPVYNFDMTFLGLPDNSYDLVFARHVLEHSPFPVITLMEWRRVCRGWLALVAPAPAYWGIQGRNHYSVLDMPRLKWLLSRAGWNPIHEVVIKTSDKLFREAHPEVDHPKHRTVEVEYRFLCEQVKEQIE